MWAKNSQQNFRLVFGIYFNIYSFLSGVNWPRIFLLTNYFFFDSNDLFVKTLPSLELLRLLASLV